MNGKQRSGDPASSATAAYIGLGSNIGDREHYLREAIRMLDETQGLHVAGCSAVYETEPVGYVDQSPFLNMVIRVDALLTPMQLLERMQQVELALGRTREIRWGPRTIDLDLLLYGTCSMETPELTIPHPRMNERAFVKIPLLDVLRPEDRTEEMGNSAAAALVGKEGVSLWKSKLWPTG